VEAETWRQTAVRRVLPDDAESESIVMWAVPPESEMVSPQLIAGRWLLPEDENAIVLSNGVLQEEDDLAIGDEILLNIRGREIPWRIVGEVSTIGGARWAYVSYDAYGRAAREVGAAGVLQVRTQPNTPAVQGEVAAALDEHLSSLGINVTSTETNANIRAQNETFFNGVVAVLLALAVLIAIVGGLGLAGTMSLNVLERIREIGVMRAIGASDMAVLQIVVVEGLVLGFLSWLLAALLSFPMSMLFSEQVGMQLFSFPLTFSFSVAGAIWWLILSLVLAAVASFLPAWNASRVTVRDVLAYE
jgi:putative ABC transport system permease protein